MDCPYSGGQPIDRARRDIEAGAAQLDQGCIVDAGIFFDEWDTELDALEFAGARNRAVEG